MSTLQGIIEAEALREVDAGHEQAAERILAGTGLDELSGREFERVCALFAWSTDR